MALTVTFDDGTNQRVTTVANQKALRILEMFSIIIARQVDEGDLDYFIRALNEMVGAKLQWYEQRQAFNSVQKDTDLFTP